MATTIISRSGTTLRGLRGPLKAATRLLLAVVLARPKGPRFASLAEAEYAYNHAISDLFFNYPE